MNSSVLTFSEVNFYENVFFSGNVACFLSRNFFSIGCCSLSLLFSAVSPTTDTQQILDDLGGVSALHLESAFTCVTIEVPLGHFNPADTLDFAGCICCPACLRTAKGCSSQQQADPAPWGVLSTGPHPSGFDASIPEFF